MYSHSRKLLIPPEFDDDPTTTTTTTVILPHHFSSASPPTNSQTSNSPLHSTPPPSSSNLHQSHNTRHDHYTTTPTTYKLSSPFDSSMALTVLVLLTAFFFMAFFSLYIRRFAEDSSTDPSTFLRRRRRGHNSSTASLSTPNTRPSKGVDPNTIRSLPVYCFSGEKNATAATATADIGDCAICLSEFELGEWLKLIPFCGHVFHVGCIDAWLGSHRTCPLCRTEKIFPRPKVAVELAEGQDDDDVLGSSNSNRRCVEMGTGLTVDESDTWRVVVEVGNGGGVRRSSSWSWDVRSSSVVVGPVRDDERLHRSFSF